MPKDPSSVKILLVDDTKSILAVAKSVLISAGYVNVNPIDKGVNALKFVKGLKIDLIICDWEMPEVSGLDILQAMRESDKNKETPFLMITGMTESAKVKEAILQGVNGYIAKPFQPAKLLQEVEKLI